MTDASVPLKVIDGGAWVSTGDRRFQPATKRLAVILHHAKCMIANCDDYTDEDWRAAEILRNVALAGADTCDRVMREMAKLQWPDDPSPLEEQGYEAGSREREDA